MFCIVEDCVGQALGVGMLVVNMEKRRGTVVRILPPCDNRHEAEALILSKGQYEYWPCAGLSVVIPS